VFPTFGRFLLLALLTGMIRGYDDQRRCPRPRHVVQAIQPLLPTPPRRYGGRPRVDERAVLVASSTSYAPASPGGCSRWRARQPGHLLAAAARLAARQVWRRLHHLLLDQLGRDGKLD
jgi:hypothetical protein